MDLLPDLWKVVADYADLENVRAIKDRVALLNQNRQPENEEDFYWSGFFDQLPPQCAQFHEAVLLGAAAAGHLHLVGRFAHDNTMYKPAFVTAIASGQLHVAQWLHEEKNQHITDTMAYLASANGHVPILAWMKNVSKVFMIQGVDGRVEDVAARNGHLQVLKWTFEERKLRPYNWTIIAAARYGQLHIVQWLVNTVKCDPAFMGHYALRDAIRCGHLGIVRWLVENTAPDPSMLTSDAIQLAIENKHHHVAGYLQTLEICHLEKN